jgi:hypothetical protein
MPFHQASPDGGHRAKWEEGSFEYRYNPALLHLFQADGPLLERLKILARQCWDLFSLRGTPASISGSTGKDTPGSWRSMPTPACHRTPGSSPQRRKLGFSSPTLQRILGDMATSGSVEIIAAGDVIKCLNH